MSMVNIVLFDMDGTLTPARKKMDMSVLRALKELQDAGYDIGIVTGSGLDYLKEQCDIMFEDLNFDHKLVHYFPCNGTEYISYKNNSENFLYRMSMEKEIGSKKYRDIIYRLIENQNRLKRKTYGKHIPLTGNFIDCRGSMINWCPIGRNANHDERAIWKDLDNKHNIRNNLLDMYFRDPAYESVEVKLGGSTSFDIYPKGWDKSYVLKNFSDKDSIWFVGDKCSGSGNDKELFDAIALRSAGKSFETNGPSNTIEIIRKNILKQNRQQEE
tara:strand:- start:5495 stop:6307 length:813 start_codon:yes stop_codon:yes gene_type:complete